MTRRIATAILLTVWATLLLAASTAYVVTRSLLLEQLDESIVQRAASLPELTDRAGRRYRTEPELRDEDRYVVRDAIGRPIARPASQGEDQLESRRLTALRPKLVGKPSFSRTSDGSRVRTVTLQAYGRPLDGTDASPALVPVTVTFRGSARDFDDTLALLSWTLFASGAAGGIIAALAARTVARAALRPLDKTAAVIGSIDEGALDRRVDVTQLPPELKPTALRLNEMLSRLEDAFARRKRFLADASHELRTPVAAMLTTIEVALRRPREADDYRQTLQTALTDAKLMHQLVDSLMSQARAELVALDEPVETVDLRMLVAQIVNSLSAVADERGVHVQGNVSVDSATISVQPSRIRSVMINLLSNAIEHSDRGDVVTISVSRGIADMLRMMVRDNGTGIAADNVPHIFEPFYRADNARGGESSHLGLGLFLTKTHVQMMGGTIEVFSKDGEGTSFIIDIPAGPSVAPKQASPATAPTQLAAAATPTTAATGARLQQN